MKLRILILAIFIVLPSIAFAAVSATDITGQVDSTGGPKWTTTSSNNAKTNPGVQATSTYFGSHSQVAVDEAGNRLFAADEQYNRVLVYAIDADGDFVDGTPEYVLGQPDFYTSTASTTQTGMYNPNGLAYDSVNQRLFVADRGNNRVLVYDVTTITNTEPAVYVIGQADFTTSTAVTTQASTRTPYGLAYDATSTRLFVAQQGRVTVYDVASISNGENATHVLGQADYVSHSLIAPPTQKTVYPYDVAWDNESNRLFVNDGYARRVMVFDAGTSTISNNMNASYSVGCSNFTAVCAATTQSKFQNNSTGVVYDPLTHRLFVGDQKRLLVFDVSTSTISNGLNASNILGQSSWTSNLAGGGKEHFESRGLGFHSGGKLYVTSASPFGIRVFDVNSITDGEDAVGVAGVYDEDGNETFYKTSNVVNKKGFDTPQDVVVDSHNNIVWVSDEYNNRVLGFSITATGTLQDRVADYVLGQQGFNANVGAVSTSTMYEAQGLAYDPAGKRLFVKEPNAYRVTVFDVNSVTNGEDAQNILFKSNFAETSCYDTASTTTCSYYGRLAYDMNRQYLFATLPDEYRVAIFDVNSITNGEPMIYALGSSNLNDEGAGQATQNQMGEPNGIAYDPETKLLYVTDLYALRVMVYDLTTISTGMNATYVIGANNFTTVGSYTAGTTTLSYPYDVAVDTGNKIVYVADEARVVGFDMRTPSSGPSAVNLLGDEYLSVASYTVSQTGIGGATGVDFSTTTNTLYVVDGDSDRFLVYKFIDLITSSLPSGSQNIEYSTSLSSQYEQGTVSYELFSGHLPDGLSISGNTISGLPSGSGTYTFQLRAVDTVGYSKFYSQPVTYSIVISRALSGGGGGGSGGGGGVPAVVAPVAPVALPIASTTTRPAQTFIPTQIVNLSSPTPFVSGLTTSPSLSVGSRGLTVQQLQRYLNAKGFIVAKSGPGSPGNESVYFGPLTRAALAAFQKRYGITPAVGYFGPITRAVIEQVQ